MVMGGGILGYTPFLETSATDGLIDNNAFGSTGTAAAPFNLEEQLLTVGHWMNLRHIGGDATWKRFGFRYTYTQ
jgi:hypothetical protein